MSAALVLVCLALTVGLSQQRGFLSPTSEAVDQTTSRQLCPASPHELEWIGDLNLPLYVRQPLKDHLRHRSTLEDNGKTGSHIWGEVERRLHNIYHQPLVLPLHALQKAVSNLGDTRRLERVLFKLLSGRAVTVVALGGSVTVGHGPENGHTSWMARTFEWINATFPHPEHRLLNHAIPAVTSAYVASCVHSLVPDTADLVILEFTFNDGERAGSDEMEEPTRMGLERLLRKLMRMNSKLAILNMHYHPFNKYAHLWDGAEDRMELLFKYYAVTSLSMRSGMHSLLESTPSLVSKMWHEANVHPSCVGSRYVADLMIGFLQDMAAYVAQAYAGHPHVPHAEVLLDTLPGPLFHGNVGDKPEHCIFYDAFAALQASNEGWDWVDEGRQPEQHKWGFVSQQPGDEMTLQVPIADFLPLLAESRQLLVAVGVLMSYEHMGWLHVECTGGCTCPPRDINCYHPLRYSLTYWKALNVTISDGSQACELRAVNANRSTGGEHKVKLVSLLVSLEIESFIESFEY